MMGVVGSRDVQRSKGVVALIATGHSESEIATRLGVSRSLVGHWTQGVKRPAKHQRESLRLAYGIDPDAWDESHQLAAAPTEPRPLLGRRVTETDVDEAAQRLFMAAVRLISAAEQVSEPALLAKLATGATMYLDRAARMAGISLDVNESKIVRTPAWRRMMRKIWGALRDHPEARRAVKEALMATGDARSAHEAVADEDAP